MRQFMAVVVTGLVGCASAPVEAQMAAGKSGSGARSAPPPAGEFVGEGVVLVTQEVLEGWSYLYRFITEVEFVLCLEGEVRDGRIYIDGFRLARMEAPTATSVRYHPCTSDRYVGTAHNHPPTGTGNSLCYRSLPDRRSFEQDERAIVDVILCGTERFLWVLKDGSRGEEGGEEVREEP